MPEMPSSDGHLLLGMPEGKPQLVCGTRNLSDLCDDEAAGEDTIAEDETFAEDDMIILGNGLLVR